MEGGGAAFGEGEDVVVFVAEAAVAATELVVDDVAGWIYSPSLWISSLYNSGLSVSQIVDQFGDVLFPSIVL